MDIQEVFESLLNLAVQEDLGTEGDITSEAIFDNESGKAVLTSKDEGIIAGVDFFRQVFERIDHAVSLDFMVTDGDIITRNQQLAFIRGPVQSILAAERIALNFLGFLSGIASASRRCMDAASGSVLVLDTRKTLPGYRLLSKWAVRVGGAQNHRMGLYDMVMIKDNHIDSAGSIGSAVQKVRARWGGRYRIEVECRTAVEVNEALSCGVDVVMLDNMPEEELSFVLEKHKNRTVKFELSGNMNEQKISELRGTGVDYISVGAMTHSVKSFDFSLKIDMTGGAVP